MEGIPNWKKIGAQKRAALQALIPPEWRLPHPLPSPSELPDVTGKAIQQYLSPREVQITETDAATLVRKLAMGEWRSREVTLAFCHRAAVAHQMISCLHEIFFETAIKDAEDLDAYWDQDHKPTGPLHGLPVSLKDVMHVKGIGISVGFVGRLGTAGDGRFESEIVTMLRSLGAVLYVKTSVPTGSFTGETFNNIIQYTPNPKNRLLTVGGSSGGEGGLLALKGSPLGIGTDIGGSVRVPAVWNGCCGLKPATCRFPFHGVESIVEGQTTVPFVVGFMAPSVEALTLVTRSLLSLQPWMRDPLVHEIPWRDEIFRETIRRADRQGSQLSFGIMRTDGHVHPQPPVLRAIDMTVAAIKSLGHSVIEWKPPSHAEAFKLWLKATTIDGGKNFHGSLRLTGEPAYRVDLDEFFAVKDRPSTVFGLGPSRQANAGEIMEINTAIQKYRTAYLQCWQQTAGLTDTGRPVDVFIMPVAPTPAPERGKVRYFGYTTVINVLDYTACAIPVTEVRKEIDVFPCQQYEPLNKLDQLVHDDYNAELAHGSSVGIQIVGRRLREEQVLALAEVLDREFRRSARDESKL
ncbi:hypothetical protein ASPZODRAFT_148589 [Penicilliopsis zonata CBS 506.65]|uniref:amidase n=1 Tax=Penicilliopsis zonata CBS 506.65 TaxID=1073090 RepID=A0A1L9SVX1_9EURO|nr:hypothetical protein ASPZODRAFT_148589 [Penicilliopsis zonata CBS 506.65]OJJ51284.1 hypothetical protein ASPZODRAFT_148589 [Penicilliopsis zonata CBS 506.65]